MLPPGFLQDLLSRVDITEVVGRHVTLKKAGINHKGLCPFHGEKSPSFTVSPSRQTYHCFGCGAHGDAIRFLTELTGIGFMDAVRDLAQQTGLTVPDDRSTPEDRARAAAEKARQGTLTDVLAKAGEHYRQALKSTPRAIDYLKRRGLTGAVAAQFGLGYAPEGWRTLAGVFPRYDDPLLSESGLVIVQGDEHGDPAEQKRYDRFRDRIMFPIRSVKGEVIGFGGRVLDQGEPKYLNSPETPVFHKGHELYGLYEARTAIRKAGCVLVVEGYMDVVALAQAGIGHAVATLGTACTAEHVAKLFRFTDAVVFSFDGDTAGRRAAGRALEAALPHATDTRSIRFLFLPAEHDPDSYVRDLGRAAFDEAVAQAVPLSTQLLAQAAEGCDLATAEGRARMLSQARGLVEPLPEGLLREQLVHSLAERGGLAAEALKAHWQNQAAQQRGGRGRRPADGARERPPARSAGPGDADAPWLHGGPPDDPGPDASHYADSDPGSHGGYGGGSLGGDGAGGRSGGYGAAYGGGSRDGAWRGQGGQSGQAGGWRGPGDGSRWKDRDGGGRFGGGRWKDRGEGGGRWGAEMPRATPQAPTRLDRAAWLLARHADQWHTLSDALHAWLCAQPAPHGPFFAALERLLHDHGPITLDALLTDLAQADTAGALTALTGRIRAFDTLDREPPVSDLAAVMRQLELAEVKDELTALIASGLPTEAERERYRQLEERQRLLRTPLPDASSD